MRELIRAAIRALAAAVLAVAALAPLGSAAAVRPGPALMAGADARDVTLPPGTPLGGYGGFPRRAIIPDVFARWPHAFWFRPSAGVHDPFRVRSLVLESGGTRVLWISVDLVGTDPTLVDELAEALARHGLSYSTLIVSASHTHSGPGAYADSALFAFIAVDRRSPAVRASILDGLVRSALEAEARKAPARLGIGRASVQGITQSRVGEPLDSELGILGVTSPEGRPVAMVWNYAIHGTALSRENLLLSGDLMADAGMRIERELGAPALFVNGAVADVSPLPRGWPGVTVAGSALAAGAMSAWADARPEAGTDIEVVKEPVALPAPALSLRNCLGEWVPANVMLGLSPALPSAAELIGVAFGDTAWVTIPGELETRLGLDIKAAVNDRVRRIFIAGLSNDYLGYFLTPADYKRPSYVACASLYGEWGGEIIRDAALRMLGRLGSRRERR